MGMCLGFDIPDDLLAPVTYAKRRLKMEVDPETRIPKSPEKFMGRLIRRKFIDWKYEDEIRLFVRLDHATVESGKYFCPFSEKLKLREIILGPRCELPIEGVRNIVADFKPPVVVLKSSIAYTRYEVVMHKVASRTTTKG